MWDWQKISNRGERVSHLYANDCYYAHLSLYRFAVPFARGGIVLDAGSGAGYGAAYLADHGAAFVHAIDVDPDAIAFSRHHFPRDNLAFSVMDLQEVAGLEPSSLALIIASNTLEHVPDVSAFLRVAHGMLSPGGVLVVAVPPITDERKRLHEMANPYHLNIWSPAQWLHALGGFFDVVAVHSHHLGRTDVQPDFDNRPEDVVITEDDFVFRPLGDAVVDPHTLTGLFTARVPLPVAAIPPAGAPLAFVDDSFTRPPPRIPPLDPDALAVPPTPLRALPSRAMALMREAGASGLVAEGRRYALWQARRFQARRARLPRARGDD